MGTVNIASLNLTTKLLSGFIFAPESLVPLLDFGLVSIYLEDYGHRLKYKNCLLALFDTRNPKYALAEQKITEFPSFSDYYDLKDDSGLRMLVFKVLPNLVVDLSSFKSGIMEFSDAALKVMPVVAFKNITLDIEKEIYRYNLGPN